MEVEIQLAKLMKEYDLLRRGIAQRMANEIGVHRHTIRKLLANQLKNPRLDTLGFICDWLQRNGVPSDRLPHSLLGVRPSDLGQAIATSGLVSIYVGEFHQMDPPTRTRRWIAQHDAVAMAKVVQWLSDVGSDRRRNLNVGIEYVPFRFVKGAPRVRDEHLNEDRRAAEQVFQRMMQTGMHRSAILLGSQRANHVVEVLVADLFGCEPFAPVGRTPRIPFYLTYRDDDRNVPSCFGGSEPPPWCRTPTGPGIYYMDKGRRWNALPWKDHQQDGGLIIIMRDVSTQAMQMAMFGFSGWGTELLGGQLLHGTSKLWPLPVQVGGRQVGIYVCCFSSPAHADGDGCTEARVKDTKIIALDAGILEGYLTRARDRADES